MASFTYLPTLAALRGLAMTALATASAAQGQSIVNGSFETNPPGASGWHATGQASVSAAGSNLATDGSFVGAFGVGGAFEEASGTVYQDFTLSQAGKFSFGFDAGTVFFGGFPFGVGFTFRIDDHIVTNSIPTFVTDSVSFSYYPLSTRIAGDVDLAAGSHRFAFDISRSGTLFGRGVVFVIDDIETGFIPAIAGVPEPSAWALLIMGFGAIGVGLRRQRRELAFA